MLRTPGLLTLGIENKDRLRRFIGDSRPTTMISLNDVLWAQEMANLGVPDVVLRIKTDQINDDQLHVLFRDAQEWWETVQHNYADKRLIVYVGNELNGDWNKINRFLCDALKIISESGRRGVYGNFGVGNPEPQYWSTYLSEFVSLVSKTPGQYVGLHEYFIKDWRLGIDGFRWDGSKVIDDAASVPMTNRTKWILGRYEFLTKINPNVKILLTEFGFDYVAAIANQYGFSTSLRGWRSQASENTAIDQYKSAINSLYTNKRISGIILYVWDSSFGWNDFAYNGAETILTRWNELGVNIEMGTIVNKLVEIKAKTTTPYSIRQSPVTGTILGTAPMDWWSCTYQEWEEYTTNGVVYKWGRFTGLKLATGLLGGGWIRLDGLDMRDVVVEPPPDPSQQFLTIPIPELYWGGLTSREQEIAVAMLRWTELSSKALADYIEKGIV
jgi:hypothetical protein